MAVLEQFDRLRWPVAAVIAVLALLALATPAPAATIYVGSKADAITDDNTCTLREAVIAADVDAAVLGCAGGTGDDVIVLGAGSYALTIAPSATPFDAAAGSLDVADPQGSTLSITSFAGHSVIDASGIADRAITAKSPLDLNSITVAGGDASGSHETPAGVGGAVASFDSAPLAIRRSLLFNNSASLAGGAVYATGPLLIDNSTLTANSVAVPTGMVGGGGAVNAGGATTIVHATIAANTVTSVDDTSKGGGLRYAGAVSLTGSVVADNSADGGDPDCFADGGTGSSGGYNVIENGGGGCGIALAGSDLQADPALQPLADNGGGTATMAIDASSPANDIGLTSCAGTDQRGAPRGVVESGACDAGAYEASYCAFYPANVIGTNGDDVLTSQRPQVAAIGLAGRDTLIGNGGDDGLCGGDGIDTLQGGGGSDLIVGGADVDIASYRDAGSPVNVSLDNQPNDGRAGEGDLVQTESVVGGSAADVLRGNGVPNGFLGGPGDDRLDGVAGNDSVVGGPGNDIVDGNVGDDQVRGDEGNDTLIGLDGNDRLEGDEGNDKLEGGDGNDRLFGDDGKNKLIGGDGNDTLTGGPGKDVFKCGGGRDTALASAKDKVAADCERVFGKDGGKGGGGKGKRPSARVMLRDPGAWAPEPQGPGS